MGWPCRVGGLVVLAVGGGNYDNIVAVGLPIKGVVWLWKRSLAPGVLFLMLFYTIYYVLRGLRGSI